TRDNIREKMFQRRGATSYFQNRKRRRIGQVLELVTIKFAIPEKQIPVGAESRAIAQRRGTVLRLAPRTDRAVHLTARMYNEPANSETTGILSRKRPSAFTPPTREAGVFGCRKSNGSIRTSRNPVSSSNRRTGHRKKAVSSGESPSFRFIQGTFF